MELTPEQAAAVSGGASDYLLTLNDIKGESKATQSPARSGLTKVGTGTLTYLRSTVLSSGQPYRYVKPA